MSTTLTPDVLVVGGGPAGIGASVAAARAGASTLLVERYGSLGGALTSVSLGSLCGYFAVRDGEVLPLVGGIAEEVVRRLHRMDGVATPLQWLRTASLPYDLFTMRLVLDDFLETQNLDVLMHAFASDVETYASGEVQRVRLVHKGGETWIRPRQVIDCSGDADIAAAADLDFDLDLDELQSATTMFRLGGVDTDSAANVTREQLHQHLGAAREAGRVLPRTAGGMYSVRQGVMHVNITKIPQPFNPLSPSDLTRAEATGRAQVAEYLQAFRQFVPGFERAFVLDAGHTLGVRESRRVRGVTVVTERHIESAGRCADVIACSAWPIEDHVPGGEAQWSWLTPGDYYQIPFGCMVPQGSRNILVAGRCVSANHRAQASLRVAAQCFAMGEAAGIAAAQLCTNRGGRSVADIDVTKVQQTLFDEGAFLGPPFGPEALSPREFAGFVNIGGQT